MTCPHRVVHGRWRLSLARPETATSNGRCYVQEVVDGCACALPQVREPPSDPPRTALPQHVAMVGAGTIGPDIGYYLKLAIPELKLTLVDVVQDPLDAAKTRFEGYAAKGVKRGS